MTEKIDTNVNKLIINELTKEQFEAIEEKSTTELYFLTDDDISGLPPQAGKEGKFLTTDGTEASWEEASTYHPPLLQPLWSDHKINDIQWLRADTFNWQNGDLYVAAYTHLSGDITDKELISETVAGTTVNYYLADDGHKICPATEEDNVKAIYKNFGIAWYFIVDTTEKRFKLPRTKFGFEGLRDTVGNIIEESLPNIKGRVWGDGFNSDSTLYWNSEGALSTSKRTDLSNIAQYTTTSWADNSSVIGFDASNSSSTYQDNAPVQERATQMYLYFYVGEYTQEAIEQTAGVTTEVLNTKLGVDLDTISDTGKNVISGLGMPSKTNIDLSLGASGATYTAPANGYFVIAKAPNAVGQFLYMGSDTNVRFEGISGNASDFIQATLPVAEGDVVTIGYTLGGETAVFKFVYAVGSQPTT